MNPIEMLGLKQKTDEWGQVAQEKPATDWTYFLSPEAVAKLRTVLEKAYKHREAYFRATDIKNAQLWSALLEMQMEMDKLRMEIEKLKPKETVRAFRYGAENEGIVLEKIKTIMQRTPEDSIEARNALIESLMRF